ncbi:MULTISPECIES: hypothetical protein [unclassified Mesorhizobium]|uniref:hypothetical protein n=1 Tax=unclassified Mesorhizobium TaxID=325217 RepID=UPI000FCC5CBA|nr:MULTISPECIES: hypothetical protein [unclassified Mesorhizobium]RUV25875.1 hypothetical protein EOA91_06850 [Mesorhizobium sp. M1A.F.Ca.IN.022.04.1.1]RWG34009.1 MAG: hypothetical protein EOQ60_10345 [Mesorhizobium sp.]
MAEIARDGLVIHREELKARWAYNDLMSSRSGQKRIREFKLGESDPLVLAAGQRKPFHSLGEADRNRLQEMTSKSVSGLVAALDGYSSFTCESWSKAQIVRTYVVPALDPLRQGRSVPYLTMLAAPLFKTSSGQPERTEPRVAADGIALGDEPFPLDPLIVVPNGPATFVLLDGTMRSILFVRSGETEMLVWRPT